MGEVVLKIFRVVLLVLGAIPSMMPWGSTFGIIRDAILGEIAISPP
jgi:hypothetical protein